MNWTVLWAAGPTGYRVLVRNRCRIVEKSAAECLSGDTIDDVREQARTKAVELALEHRIPLDQVSETADLF
jgi:hypothetical protein